MSFRFALTGLCVVLAASALGCATDPPAGASSSSASAAAPKGLPDRDPALAKKLVADGALLLDVRTPAEYAERHVEGAENISVQELPKRLADVEKLTGGDKKKPVVVYCQSGKRGASAKAQLLEAGYENVTNLGGVDDWPK